MTWQYRDTVLVLTTLAFIATMVARLSISAVVPLITTDFGVTNGVIGLALTGMWAAYALMQFPSGVLGDRFGERRVVLAAVGLTFLASGLLAAAPGLLTFSLVVVLLGAGAGLHYTVATTFLTDQFDDVGRAVGIHVAGGPVAGLLAPPMAAAVGVRFGWRSAMALSALVALPVFVLFAWRVRPTAPSRPDRPMRDQFELRPLLDLLARPSIAYSTVIAVLGAFTWQATASFLPTYLTVSEGFSTTVAAALFSLFFLVNGLTQPVTGWLSDRLNRDAVATLTMAAGVGSYAGIVLVDSLVGVGLAIVVMGFAMSWGAPIQSRFIDLLSADEQNVGFGIVRTVYMTGGATGSVGVGVLADLAGWDAAFTVLAWILAVALVMLLANRRLGL